MTYVFLFLAGVSTFILWYAHMYESKAVLFELDWASTIVVATVFVFCAFMSLSYAVAAYKESKYESNR